MVICHYLLFLPFIPTIKHPLPHKTRTFTSQISTIVLIDAAPASSTTKSTKNPKQRNCPQTQTVPQLSNYS